VSRDLPPKWIIIKAGLFLLVIALAVAGLLLRDPHWQTLLLAIALIWAAARFYYFLFYVIEKYIDSDYRFAGVWSALEFLWKKRKGKANERD